MSPRLHNQVQEEENINNHIYKNMDRNITAALIMTPEYCNCQCPNMRQMPHGKFTWENNKPHAAE